MGATPSPYNAVLSFAWVEEIIRGNPSDDSMPFRWQKVELNLPGSKDYNPARPWVSKRRKDGRIVHGLVTFMDDLRAIGSSEKECRVTGHRTSSVMNWHGIQDASRKSRPASQSPGAWSRGFVKANPVGFFQSMSQQKWDKFKGQIADVQLELQANNGTVDFIEFRKARGLWIYIGRTFSPLVAFFKGAHLTLESWRDSRDAEGWPQQRKHRK
jgi:hypothetical protein